MQSLRGIAQHGGGKIDADGHRHMPRNERQRIARTATEIDEQPGGIARLRRPLPQQAPDIALQPESHTIGKRSDIDRMEIPRDRVPVIRTMSRQCRCHRPFARHNLGDFRV